MLLDYPWHLRTVLTGGQGNQVLAPFPIRMPKALYYLVISFGKFLLNVLNIVERSPFKRHLNKAIMRYRVCQRGQELKQTLDDLMYF